MLRLTSNFTILIYMAVGSQPDLTRGFIVTIKCEGGRSLQGSTFCFSIYLFRIRYPNMNLAVKMYRHSG